VKQPLLFALTTTVIAVLGALVLQRIFVEPGSTAAVWVSAALAVFVQLATFAIARRYARRGDLLKGWGIGALLRVGALVAYGFAFFGPWTLSVPLEAALLSFALFLFLSTVIEPLFLTR
jgi:hypothetical protein